MDQAAVVFREAMISTMNQHARKKRRCSRSKRWWNLERQDLRKSLGKAR